MTNSEREEGIQIAIREYQAAVRSGIPERIHIALSGMENTYISVCCLRLKGTEQLRQTILAAHKRGAGRSTHEEGNISGLCNL